MGHKVEKMNHGSSFAFCLHGHPTNMLENEVCEQGADCIFMKENKTTDEMFVTSASIKVNYLHQIINETVFVYSIACESGS